MADSNLVYLTGGQTTILIERLKKMGVDNLLNELWRSYHWEKCWSIGALPKMHNHLPQQFKIQNY